MNFNISKMVYSTSVIYHELVCYDLKTDGSYRPLKTLQLL